jgi:hypothetical protein
MHCYRQSAAEMESCLSGHHERDENPAPVLSFHRILANFHASVANYPFLFKALKTRHRRHGFCTFAR